MASDPDFAFNARVVAADETAQIVDASAWPVRPNRADDAKNGPEVSLHILLGVLGAAVAAAGASAL